MDVATRLGALHCGLRQASLDHGRRALAGARRLSALAAAPSGLLAQMAARVAKRPVAFALIPTTAAGVGLVTNWMGVKMMFAPLEYTGVEVYRPAGSPYGLLGWQGVVPCRTEKMAKRLTQVVTAKLFSLHEAFGHIDPGRLATMLTPPVLEAIRRDAPHGEWWAWALRPFLWPVLRLATVELKADIGNVLDLEQVMMSAFVRDKQVLVDLFQRVGKAELDFLVQSGFYFGFLLGLAQAAAWMVAPRPWTLPVAGALVGYLTNWVAIKLLFEPAEPTAFGPFVLQGLFEARQLEVSDEFASFLAARVLTAPRLIDELANGTHKVKFEALLRRTVPFFVPDAVVSAAADGLRDVAREDLAHPTHVYIADALSIESTLSHRLKQLSPQNFEDLLHPVCQEESCHPRPHPHPDVLTWHSYCHDLTPP